jgi:hypothetical protein
MSLSLISAFGRFGSRPSNRLHSLSAIAADGAMVLNCSQAYFVHPARACFVMRTGSLEGCPVRSTPSSSAELLSRAPQPSSSAELLSQHLTLARDGALPVRMVVTSILDASRRSRSFHVRTDLIGKVVKFDGDHFVVDFTRREELDETMTVARRKRGRRESS